MEEEEAPESCSLNKIKHDKNHVYFYSEVDRNTTYQLIQCLREAENYCVKLCHETKIETIPIYLHISSYGGCVDSAFNVVDHIRSSKYPVYTIIEGYTASSGTIISVVGKKRFIRPNANMLIHQISSGFWGKMLELEDQIANLKYVMMKLRRIYRKNTKIPKKQLAVLLKHDLMLNSKKCIELGLVDELWN
jgi:ATP-dependent protease ClpP protease subunit